VIPPHHDAAFAAAMEDILAVYARPVDAARPLVCFDEAGKELTAHTRPPRPASPGQPAREDTEYARGGKANLFLACAPHLGWRQISVTPQRTGVDFAHALRDLVDQAFPEAARIVLVLDNLNTHDPPRCTKPSRRTRRGASWTGSSGTSPLSMALGSTSPSWSGRC
jgi:hypothetical protein